VTSTGAIGDPGASSEGATGEFVPLETARPIVLHLLHALGARQVSLAHARDCRLAVDVRAPIPLPPFDNAAMDGYAVRLGPGAGSARWVPRSDAWPISTGMPIPTGADAVVPIERVGEERERLRFDTDVRSGDHIRRAGEELAAGGLGLPGGSRLTPAAIGLLSSFGLDSALVVPRPRVAILVTGDEVAEPGRPLPAGHIYDADGPLLRALVEEAGGDVIASERLPDDPLRIGRRLSGLAQEADLVCTSGGASLGSRDHLMAQLRRLGSLVIHQLAIKPGRPTSVGLIGQTPVFVLPGNPLASLVGFEAVVRPALRRLAGDSDPLRPRSPAVARGPIPHRPGRLELVPIRIVGAGPMPEVEAVVERGSAMLSGAAIADGLALIDADRGTVVPGDRLTVEWWGSVR
jgi:molybdopterin molybdotransferase